MKKIRYTAVLLLIALVLCSCGTSAKSDGIDSVTYISDIAQPAPASSTKPVEKEPAAVSAAALAEYEGAQFSASIWQLFMGEALDSVLSKYDVEPKDVPLLEVMLDDGNVITAKEFCEANARNEFEWVCLLYSEYLKGGRELSESAYFKAAASNANHDYELNAKKYSKLGISLNDLILYYIYTDLYYEDFVISRSPGAENAIPDTDLSTLMENNVRKISYTFLPLYNELTNEDYSDSEKQEMIKLSEEYLNRYKNGESFLDIVTENCMLLDPHNANYNSGNTYIYYPITDPMLPAAITDKAETLKDYEAAMVVKDDFVSVVLRMPVNETKDDAWLTCALEQAYLSSYGDDYAESMSDRYDRMDIRYDETLLDELTLENYINDVYGK